MEQSQKRERKKIYRWIFFGLLVLSVVGAQIIAPVTPHIQLPAEKLTHDPLFTAPVIGEFYLTNTMVATLIADLLLILLALGIRRATRKDELIIGGFTGAIAALLEGLYGMAESTAGKWARRIFPYFATIFLLVLVVNWMELIPGVDSIGILEHSDHGNPVQQVLPGVMTIVKGDAGEEAEEHGESGYALVPYVRVASTDLNFTIALALASVFMTQVIGLRALGVGYLTKYWNTHSLGAAWKQPRFGNPLDFIKGLIDWAVGLLEIIAEFAKIISFSFRLFGNIFAGSVMLFVLGSLVPVFVQSLLLMLEMFVGVIQAFVFGMLTLVFMSQATQGHGDHAEAH